MCGISAIISKNGNIAEHQLGAMCHSIGHRGPDGHGVYLSDDLGVGLGHQRLSLVELSANGAQPMTKHDRTIVFNGEIYNYRELLRELKGIGYQFLSHSDTEVILTAFEAWGIKCIERFNGAFAFVLYEHDSREVYVVRDRIGEKPLYYTETGSSFAFASEIKSLKNIPGVKFTPDYETIHSNLIFHFFADKEATYFKNIKSVRPGHYLRLRNGALESKEYWNLHVTDMATFADESSDIERSIDDIQDLLEDSVRLRLSADAEVGSLLSGGLDSSLLTMIAAKQSNYPIKCFSLYMENQHDEDYESAKRLVAETDNLVHVPVAINDDLFYVRSLDEAATHLEEIALHKSLYINKNYRTVQRHGVKTVLNGQGSDEISLGYYNFYDFLRFDEKALELQNFASHWQDGYAFKNYASKQDVENLIQFNLQKNYVPYKSTDLLNSVLAFAVKTHLLNILNHEDRFSMANSVECRTAFTDYRIIEKFMSIPSKYKVYDGREKYLVRRLGERLLPKGIAERKKTSFLRVRSDQEAKMIYDIVSSVDFRRSNVLNHLFDESIFNDIASMPLSLQWKLANLYRFEKVFYSSEAVHY